jgi:hypothetical protein
MPNQFRVGAVFDLVGVAFGILPPATLALPCAAAFGILPPATLALPCAAALAAIALDVNADGDVDL